MEEPDQEISVRRWRARSIAIGMALACGLIFIGVRGWIRSFGGDILVVIFLVACLASIPVGRPRSRLIGVGAFAVSVECFQGLGWVTRDAHWLAHLILGSTFDPVDLVAYGIGLAMAAACEHWWAQETSSTTPST